MQLFFGMDTIAPWPGQFPGGRILEEKDRHMTLAFLGNGDEKKLLNLLSNFPKPNFKVGIVGKFDQCLFLPSLHPHVVAWNIDWLEASDPFDTFLKEFDEWLNIQGFSSDRKHPFTPHVTIARGEFIVKDWKKQFEPLPMVATDIHLFESLGFSKYRPLWTHHLKTPFEEIEHTGDIAYIVRAKDLTQLFEHAQVALAFPFPPILPFLSKRKEFHSLGEIIMKLNTIVSKADQEIGVPYKAVSFHGKIQEEEDQTLSWEMIVDV